MHKSRVNSKEKRKIRNQTRCTTASCIIVIYGTHCSLVDRSNEFAWFASFRPQGKYHTTSDSSWVDFRFDIYSVYPNTHRTRHHKHFCTGTRCLLRNSEGAFVSSRADKAKVLNAQFVKVQNPCPAHCKMPITNSISKIDAAFYLNESDVWRSLKQLSMRTSSGPFPFTIQLLKTAGSSLIVPLKQLFEK